MIRIFVLAIFIGIVGKLIFLWNENSGFYAAFITMVVVGFIPIAIKNSRYEKAEDSLEIKRVRAELNGLCLGV